MGKLYDAIDGELRSFIEAETIAHLRNGGRMTPELLLFDFGGVLVEFAGPKELGQHLRWDSTPEGILDRWTKCPHTDDFECGRLSPLQWAERFIHTWDVDLQPEEFLAKFTTWSRRVLPGAQDFWNNYVRDIGWPH